MCLYWASASKLENAKNPPILYSIDINVVETCNGTTWIVPSVFSFLYVNIVPDSIIDVVNCGISLAEEKNNEDADGEKFLCTQGVEITFAVPVSPLVPSFPSSPEQEIVNKIVNAISNTFEIVFLKFFIL